jgi:hypothetical protein
MQMKQADFDNLKLGGNGLLPVPSSFGAAHDGLIGVRS